MKEYTQMKKNKFLGSPNPITNKRLPHELPIAISLYNWRYHHIGVPYMQSHLSEAYHQNLKLAAYGFDTSPYGIEWFRLDQETPVQVSELVRKFPHVAFEIDSIDEAIKDQEILIRPHRLLDGVTIAMFLHNGMPIEVMEFDNKNDEQIRIKNSTVDSSGRLIHKRLKHEPPVAIAEYGWQYHHLGVPYTEPKEGEIYHEHLKIYTLGFDTSPYGIEWVRFEKDCKVPSIIRHIPHLAFAVDNLDKVLEDKEILLEPSMPSGGVRVAFIVHDGAPIELMEFDIKI